MRSQFEEDLQLRQVLHDLYAQQWEEHAERAWESQQKMRLQEALIRDHQLTMAEIRAGGEAVMEEIQKLVTLKARLDETWGRIESVLGSM